MRKPNFLGPWGQDLVYSNDATAHFDNCTFEESIAYVEKLLNDADGQVKAGKPNDAVTSIGRALHGIQDFYSHSNYVELMAHRHPTDFKAVKIVAVWTVDGQKSIEPLIKEGLVSGRFPDSPRRCGLTAPNHKDLAKDSRTFNAAARKIVPGWANRTY